MCMNVSLRTSEMKYFRIYAYKDFCFGLRNPPKVRKRIFETHSRFTDLFLKNEDKCWKHAQIIILNE